MHHFPSGPSLSARASAALRRWLLAPLRARRALPVLIGLVVGVIALAVPVVSSAVGSPVSLDDSSLASGSARATGDSPVVMGVDGKPLPTTGGGSTASTDPASSADATPDGGTTDGATTDGATTDGSTADGATPAGTPSGGTTSVGTTTGSAAGGSSSSSSSSVPPSSSGSPSSDPEPVAVPAAVPGAGAAVLALVNNARSDEGCDPLTADSGLAGTAGADSMEMAADGSLGSVDGSAAAVATGSSDASTIVRGWLADATDSAHLLDCSLTSAGAAAATGSGSTWWTLLLA